MSDEYVPTLPQDSEESGSSTGVEEDQRFPQLEQKLLDRYEIFGIKEGGFGIVYFVNDLETESDYAAKTFKPELAGSLPDVEWFRAEIGFWINLEPHPNIVRAYFVEMINERPYLFMEYVPHTLRAEIGRLSFHQAVNFAYQICLAMEFINRTQSKIVHADLKPENILITNEGTAKVTDFGLARLFNFTQASFPHQSSGSLPYMPPEQLRGEIVDQQSDIFSYGIMFYEMLAGRRPYPFEVQGSSPERRKQLEEFYDQMGRAFFTDEMSLSPWKVILEDETLDYSLKQILIGCLIPRRGNRWRSFRELRQYLEAALQETIEKPKSGRGALDLHRKALSLYRIGRLSEALSAFNLALKRDPTNAELWRDAALALVDNGEPLFARQFLSQAKKLNLDIEITEPKLKRLVDESDGSTE